MNDEIAFLRAIADEPGDIAPRRVFADWLDEQGETGKADYLRAGVALTENPPEPRYRHLVERLWEGAWTIDPKWREAAGCRVDFLLTAYPAGQKINVIIRLREVTSLDLLQAVSAIEALPWCRNALLREDAERLRCRFAQCDATVSLPACARATIDHPTQFAPRNGLANLYLHEPSAEDESNIANSLRELFGLTEREARSRISRLGRRETDGAETIIANALREAFGLTEEEARRRISRRDRRLLHDEATTAVEACARALNAHPGITVRVVLSGDKIQYIDTR